MEHILINLGLLLASYIFGSIPFGLIIVKLITGQDIRKVESGRTGGTNAMRAAGPLAGALTAFLDGAKAAIVIWLAKAVTGDPWMHALTPIFTILGHNYSIFLAERNPQGRLHLRGGAGGAAAYGGALGLWWPAGLIMAPFVFLVWYGVGYASVTTMSIPLLAVLIFIVRSLFCGSPWEYVLYGILAEVLLIWALRPNIKRLRQGTERLHGWRARRQTVKTEPPAGDTGGKGGSFF